MAAHRAGRELASAAPDDPVPPKAEKEEMDFTMLIVLTSLGLFLGMLLFSELGRRLGIAKLAIDADGGTKGASVAEGAVFGLLGLLIAFTFSGAANRFDIRRDLISAEENAIGTAYLRIDVLPADVQPQMRDLFRRYLDARLATYRNLQDETVLTPDMKRAAIMGEVVVTDDMRQATALQNEIWVTAMTALKRPEVPGPATIILVPALNEMFDITATRAMATRHHPPFVVHVLMVVLCLIGAMLVGYATAPNRERTWFHTVIFAAILSMTVFVIVDLEYPRAGFIRVDSADEVLVRLREGMDD